MKILISALLLILAFQLSFGQEKSKARLIDEFGKHCDESVMASYMNFAVEKQNQPTSKAIIIYYGSEIDEGGNLSLIDWFKSYGNFNLEVQIFRGANRKEPKTQFWIVPEGAEMPKPETEFVSPVFNKKIRFDLASAFIEDEATGDLQQSHSEFGCQLNPNRKEFAKVLLENNNLNGLVIVDNQKKSVAYYVANLIVNQLTKIYRVPRNRFQLNFRHKSEFGKAELWFIPKKKSL